MITSFLLLGVDFSSYTSCVYHHRFKKLKDDQGNDGEEDDNGVSAVTGALLGSASASNIGVFLHSGVIGDTHGCS